MLICLIMVETESTRDELLENSCHTVIRCRPFVSLRACGQALRVGIHMYMILCSCTKNVERRNG